MKRVLFCMEDTGKYNRPFLNVAESKSINVWVEYPLVIKRSMGITRGKTDKWMPGVLPGMLIALLTEPGSGSHWIKQSKKSGACNPNVAFLLKHSYSLVRNIRQTLLLNTFFLRYDKR